MYTYNNTTSASVDTTSSRPMNNAIASNASLLCIWFLVCLYIPQHE
jgi:hypothetical protein